MISQETNNWTQPFSRFFKGSRTTDIQEERNARVATAVKKVVAEERAIAKTALATPSRRYPIAIIGSSVMNVAVLALEGVSAFVSSPILSTVLGVCGIAGGILNLKEGILAIKEGMSAWKNNDKKLAIRLLMQGVLESALGLVMLLISVAHLVGITSVTAAFAANPYVMPALFFCLALFLLIETMTRLGPVMRGTDLGSKLELPKLRELFEKKPYEIAIKEAQKWVESKIGQCYDPDPAKQSKAVDDKVNEYKAEIGFTAGTEAFKLFADILAKKKKEEILQRIKSLEDSISSWNQALYLKLTSVLLATAGFATCMRAMAVHSETLDGIQSLGMAASATIPLYLDSCRPFERQIPIVIQRKPSTAETAPAATKLQAS